MAVAYDASSESHTGTTPSSSEASFSWTHTPAGTPKGVLVFVPCLGTPADLSTGVTYGGVALTTDAAWFAQDTLNEAGSCRAYFLGSGIPTGAQTVVVSRTNTVDHVYAVCVTVTAAGHTEVYTPGVVLLQEDGTLAEQSVTDGSPGTDSLRFAGGSFGHADVPAAGANSTAVHNIDIGIRVAGVVRETTAGQGPRSVGFSDATSDDRAVVHLAVREVPGGTTYQVTLAGGLTPAGGVVRRVTTVLAADLTPTGILVRQTMTQLIAMITPSGVVGRVVTTTLVGAMTPSGFVAPLKTALLALAGALTPAAALVRSAAVQLAGTLAPAGALARSVATVLAGMIAPAGAVVRMASKLLAGGVTPSGVLSSLKVAVLAVAGSVAPTGALLRAISKHLAGAVTPDGSLGRRVAKLVDAALTPVGDLARWMVKPVAGVLAPSGTLGTLKSAVVVLVAALTPSGGLVRRVTKILDGVVAPVGTLITSAIIAAGNLLKLTAGIAIRPALGAAQRVRGPLAAAARVLARLRGSPDIGPEA